MQSPSPAPHHPRRPPPRRVRRWIFALAATALLAACTQTPPPPPPPSGPQIVAFAADPATAALGESVTLSWQTLRTDTLRLRPGNVDVTGTTSIVVSPPATTTYTLVATNGAGAVSASIDVSVGPLPVIDVFVADAGPEINPGLPGTLSWSVEGADRIDLLGPGLGAGVEVTGSDDYAIAALPAGATYTLVAANAFGSVEAEVVAARDVPAFSVLLAGQSNAQGFNVDPTAALTFITADAGVGMLGNDYVWKGAYEPLDDCLNQVDSVSQDPAGPMCTQFGMNNSGVSPGVSFGNAVAAATGGEVFLVPAARGGSSSNNWLPLGAPYDRTRLFGSAAHRASLLELERAAPLGHEFDGVPYGALVWYQGETDSSDLATVANFTTRTTTILNTFRAEFDAPTLLVQLSRRGFVSPTDDGVERNLNYQLIREIQRRLATGAREATSSGTLSPVALPRTYLVVTHDLPMHPGDGRHLSAAGQVELGRRLSLAVREHLLDEAGVDGSGPQLVRVEKFSNTEVRIHTDRPVRPPSTTTAGAYSGYFTVVHSGAPVAISSIQRSTTDDRVVRILLGASVAGPVQVRYMPPPGIITALAPDVIRSASCGAETIPGTSLCLPMAAFGDVISAGESSIRREDRSGA
jgi:hypothetical protein